MNAKEKADFEARLQAKMATFYADPLGHVMFSYPWKTEKSIQVVPLPVQYRERFPGFLYGPDLWACEFMDELGAEIKKRNFNGRTAVMPIRFCTASGHGIGKSVDCAWLIKFIMDTRPMARGKVTSGKAEQLRSNTWSELGFWHKISMTQHWFEYTSGRGSMALRHKEYPEKWKVEATTAKEENAQSFAGLHAVNSTPFYIFDEASAIPDAIYVVRDGGTTDGEPMTFDFGNPTRNSGRFYDQCEGKLKGRYIVRNIDSRDVYITNKELFKEWAEDFGEDSDYFRVRVRGEFPKQGSTQFIATDDVRAALRRATYDDVHAPLIIGVDVARFGEDASVIYPRIGMDARSFGFKMFRGLDTQDLAAKVNEEVKFFRNLGRNPDGIFIDETGVGGGVVDACRKLGLDVTGVNFGKTAYKATTYRYRADEMWGNMREAIKTRLALPDSDDAADVSDLEAQLTAREFGFTLNGHKIHLETKEQLRKRKQPSPDIADALALTFAEEILTRKSTPMMGHNGGPPMNAQADYDPFSQTW